MRKPDNIVWDWSGRCFGFGWYFQDYFVTAKTFTLCLGVLTLRWHTNKSKRTRK